MSPLRLRKDPRLKEDLQHLEQQLAVILQPVSPRPGFVRDLRKALMAREIQPATSKWNLQMLDKRLLVAGGVLGGVLMLLTSIRGIISLISVVGLLIQWFTRNSQRRQTTPA